jgi:exodeoxyribonuclease VII large subunit
MQSQKRLEDEDLKEYLTVTALTKYIKAKLEGDKHLFSILLKGEISNFKRHSRGHLYFTLKDENAQISAIMFSRDTNSMNFIPKEGDHVLVSGRISLYEPSGAYSIQINEMTLDGIGELYLKYEALKKDLEQKGYFDPSHKKPIPKFPKKIGVITSPTGAVIEDIKNTISRRYMLSEIHLYPALVQGQGSAESIRNMILLANQKAEVDVIIVGRGGGSIEDLWAFNEMPVIEAIYSSKIPIITAIGHETDYTISDFVSDLRAPTPTAAAELVTPNKLDLLTKIDELVLQMDYKIQSYISQIKTILVHMDQRLDRLAPDKIILDLKKDVDQYFKKMNYAFQSSIYQKKLSLEKYKSEIKNPSDRILKFQSEQHQLQKRLIQAYQNRYNMILYEMHQLSLKLSNQVHSIFDIKLHQFDILKTKLSLSNPLDMMDKGFAVIKKDEKLLTSILQVEINDLLEVRMKDGYLKTKVIEKKEHKDGK